jgi:hypothetical protein
VEPVRNGDGRGMFVALVYQNGLANVFVLETYQRPESPEGRMAKRVLQHDYSACEWFARGMGQCGATVDTYHCDELGDIAARPWKPGPGELFQESKLSGGASGLRMNV